MLYAIVAVIALILDQLLKYWTTINIVVNTGRMELIPGFIHLTNVHNDGAAFSFLQGARWFFVALCVVFAVVVIVLLARRVINTPAARWAAVIVLAGAVGNAIDRVITGYVVDMLEFDFLIFGMRFPVFNIADIYITVGAILFCIFLLVEKPKAKDSGIPEGETPASPVITMTAEQQKKPAEPSGPVVYTQPRPVEPQSVPKPAQVAAPRSNVTPISQSVPQPVTPPNSRPSTKTEQVMRMLVNGVPPQQPAAPQRPAAKPKSSGSDYDLDDILAEFRE